MFKVIVAGGRDFNNDKLMKKALNNLLSLKIQSNETIQIVSGGAKGDDFLGELYAEENSLPLKIFKAEWDKYGKSAGYIRNEEMAKYADACICFLEW